MSPRIKLGEGFSVTREREFQLMGSWMPVTPEKPIPTRSNPVPVDRYGNPLGRENWQELPGFSGGHIQQMPDYNRAVPNLNLIGQADQNEGYYGSSIGADNRNRMINHIAALYHGGAVWNNNQLVNLPTMKNTAVLTSANGTHGSSTSMANGPPIQNLHSQVGNWREVNLLHHRESNSSNLLPHRESNLRNLLPQMESNSANCLLPRESNMSNFLQQSESNLSSLFQQSESNLADLFQQRQSNSSHFLQQRESNSSHLLQQRESNSSHLLLQRESNSSHLLIQRESNLNHLLLQGESNLRNSWLHGQNHGSGSNLSSNSGSFHQISQYEVPVPCRPDYKLHSPPRSEADAASSVTATFPFSPVTPDPSKKLESKKYLTIAKFLADESSIQEKDKQENFVTSTENEAIQHNNDELLQNVVDLSSVVNSRPLEEKRESDNGNDQGIDLNKTPQLKPPKRRKHRPKVIVEGKPKRTPKAATPKTTKTEENPGGKRKYVRKKQLKDSETDQATKLRETADASTGTVARRALNFDLEKIGDESQVEDIGQQEETQRRCKRTFNLNLNSQATELDSRINSEYRTEATMLIGQQNGIPTDTLQPGTINNHTHFINQIPGDNISVPEKQAMAASVPPRKDLHTENLNVIARNVETRIGDPSQKNSTNGYIPIQQNTCAKRIGPAVFQTNTGLENFERTIQMLAQSTRQPAPNILSILKEARGSKREYHHATEQTQPCAEDQMGSSFRCQNIFQKDEFQRNSSFLGAGSSETQKKRKIENGLHANINGRLSGITAVQDGSRLNGNGLTLHANYHMLNSQLGSNNVARGGNSGFNNVVSDQNAQSMASGQHVSFVQDSLTDKMGGTNRLTSVHNFVPLVASEKHNLIPPTPPSKAPAPGGRRTPKTFCDSIPSKQNVKPTLAKSATSGMDQVLPEQRIALYYHQQFSAKTGGPPLKQICPISMDEIIRRFKGLNLNGRDGQAQEQEQNAIVPYKQDGTVVPYEGFDFIKKRKPRPKVDLDPETNRIWKLLMGKESEGLEGTNKDKEKWWEEERRVFQGRADSFIARMHLVQGDRRFSKWKGSVVDSVIGVFLTQNVSDHLSSSAFMSLASRFPIKSNNRTSYMNGTNILVEEPEVCVSSPNDAIQWNEQLLKNPLYSQSSTTPHEPTQRERQSENSRIERTSLLEVHSHSMEEEVLSSQESFTSSILQGNGWIRSSSGSNSEAEDPTYVCMPNQDSGSKNSLQVQSANLFQEFYNCLNESSPFQEGYGHGHKLPENTEHGQQRSRMDSMVNLDSSLTFTQLLNFNNPQNQAPLFPPSNYNLNKTSYSELLEGSDIYSDDCISFFPSTGSEFPKARDENYTSRRVGQLAELVGETTIQQNGLPMSEKMPTQHLHALSSKHSMQEPNGSQWGSHSDNHQHVREKTFQCESRSLTEPVNLVEAPAKAQNNIMQHVPNAPDLAKRTFDVEERVSVVNKQTHLENKLIEPNSGGQALSAHKPYDEANPNISKSKKVKADDEKKNAVDWDSLRKQVQSNGRKTERTKDTMDSLDYEALRCANVKEISDAIKERGMNNMLAERIKEFLNRLVRDHGSIDLEWLRDVPPDKAKDYLLSVRGLGLKSVECVRLLTLHHLAFPVDTNVGRIAVRLGWVPLQPLPESLQLHLLELYPILESIQKYLWPRLCKLDQRTLYELHYQLITFGKVFCTKSKPNCNACPMRGECRHFASAFTSARLALPGPEEKGIVRSTVPITAERNPEVVINPVLLPPPEKDSLKGGWEVNKCVPIIEEPATPEPQCTEVSESDIEDTFFEDPDEIPTIKLNIEEFTVNLQNYMQENMELQELDMSKALVALNSDVASIPTPKLKNVSRLRTEHQVYQLPDSHPLLNGMDRREQDDPSPYLLAIWTPGETANSIQPPEKRCGSQESGQLCNDTTCFSCNSVREANSQTVRGTLLIPCRTAMRGSFPLNGTYFQVNEVFADHASSLNPIDVPREWIWNLPRRIVYFGTSVSSIFKGLSTEGIQYCFWKGFVCVRGFDQKLRAPRPLMARLHFPASKLVKTKNEKK
ncbi:hypothetical protein JRO89_XS14G0016100 [Xanthoceras sorbifolium]|uniref:HhH-GPD domain-containing protein n=1 Tax=Xanthoceras sorbifolium TaxID=99658 RepID=A0ABQ8H396_9ROSI|nr:hypothetical protein JRO89_XS14G0016100 [Xanthoceras sorbifolium]